MLLITRKDLIEHRVYIGLICSESLSHWKDQEMEYPFVANCYLMDFVVLLEPCWTVLTFCENCWFWLREQNLRTCPVF
jgi:hypothetical protein